MEEKINKLKDTYKNLSFEKKDFTLFDEDETSFFYEVSGFEGNKELILIVDDENDYKILEEVLKKKFSFTPIHFGVEYENKIEIALSAVNPRSNHMSRFRLKEKSAEIEMSFFHNQLDISIQFQPESSLMTQLMEIMRGKRSTILMTISGYKNPTSEGKEGDLRNIIMSTLFDFSYSYNLVFEPTNFESLIRRTPLRKKKRLAAPSEKIQFVYRKYIPELVEYFNIGEKVDYPPFRFICYFHIIEYFSDKSAFYYAAKKLKSLMIKPDFHINTDKYVNQAINFFKIESTKYTSDKIKIRRVINQFISRIEFEEYLNEIDALEYFKKSVIITCSKPLELPAIDFENDSKFEESLMQRIYAMRCSIVHSNPDFEETKAIPFSPTPDNLDKLKKEMEMIYEVARTIIVESTQ